MEPFVPLVKAILISSMFSWGTSSVVITENYMLKENIFSSDFMGREKDYVLFDLRKNIIYLVNQDLSNKSIIAAATHYHNFEIRGDVEVLSASVSKDKLDGYNCKVIEESMKRRFPPSDMSTYTFKRISYYAKIDWLDRVLDTPAKRKFAEFIHDDYSPHHYLLSRYIEYEGGSSKNEILTIIEQSEVDTSLIATLLALPTIE